MIKTPDFLSFGGGPPIWEKLLSLICEERCRLCDDVLGIAREIFLNAGLDGSPALLHTLGGENAEVRMSRVICQLCWNRLVDREPLFGFCPLEESPESNSDSGETNPSEELDKWLPIASGAAYSGKLRKLVHRLKFLDDRLLAADLAAVALTAWQPLSTMVDESDCLVVPVPLHWKRRFKRGFNQTELIAREIARALNCRISSKSLKRCKATSPQNKLTRERRSANVASAFTADSRAVSGKTVLLIDDVCTSGATLAECARTVRSAGARAVVALTVARAMMRSDRAKSKTRVCQPPQSAFKEESSAADELQYSNSDPEPAARA